MRDPFDFPHLPRHLTREELVFAPFDPTILVQLAREDDHGIPGLADALAQATEAAQACDCYLHFAREELPPPLATAILDGFRFGVDVAADGRVAGVERLDRLPFGSEEG